MTSVIMHFIQSVSNQNSNCYAKSLQTYDNVNLDFILRIFLRTVATCSRPITKILLNFCYVNYANPQV